MWEKIKNNWFFYVVIILLIILIGYTIWSTQSQIAEAPTTEEVVVEVEEAVEVEEEATEAAKEVIPAEVEEATPAAEEEAEEALIKEAVLERVKLDEEEVEFTITTNTGTYAKGLIREVGAVSGGYWLAAKSDGEWVAVYDGQANPPCEDVDLYDFPTGLVSECLDENGQLVTR